MKWSAFVNISDFLLSFVIETFFSSALKVDDENKIQGKKVVVQQFQEW